MDTFDIKYSEFAKNLVGTCPELESHIKKALELTPEARKAEFKRQVLPFCSPKRDSSVRPNVVLPGVEMPEDIWSTLSMNSKKAIQEYLTLLSFMFLLDNHAFGGEAGADETSGGETEWMKGMMDDMKEKMKNIDFAELSEKMANLFGTAAASGKAGAGGFTPGRFDGLFPQLPEKFLKGQIAKLAEDIIKEFDVKDFGIDPAVLEGKDPSKALQIIMELFMNNPQNFQATIMKLSKKIQKKIQSGALRPQELVAEAEELMKTFSENPQFVELMESFRKSFGAEDPEVARRTNRETDNRLSIVKDRLRKKLEAKKGKK